MKALFAKPIVRVRFQSLIPELVAAALVFALIYSLVILARHLWMQTATTSVEISHRPADLPWYALYSFARISVAYVFSLIFAVAYGYAAARVPKAERFLIPLLDILQSIPVLSFLPGVMMLMIALFPTRQLGVELGSLVLIFTGQAWNMAFSFYSAMKTIPRELAECAASFRLNAWQRFFQLELPFAAIGLVWNSIVSVAGGWFFLMACEMFVLQKHDFRLPGLGSYLQTSASAGDLSAMLLGLLAMIAVIVATDRLVWHPLIEWSDKFKFEQVQKSGKRQVSPWALLKEVRLFVPLQRALLQTADSVDLTLCTNPTPSLGEATRRLIRIPQAVRQGFVITVVAFAIFVAAHSISLLSGISKNEYRQLFVGLGATFLRVNGALLLAAAWTVPVGVAIGLHPGLAKIAQPITQIAASVPATALFPLLLFALLRAGGGLGLGSIALMLLGTQWYLLFNVVAGAMAIPSELRDVASIFGFGAVARWRYVILPGIFPYLITGVVTASGGAWNASIVAEYFHLRGKLLSTTGLGAQISAASDAGRSDLLLCSTILMAGIVVTTNRLVWRRLYHLAETRFKLEG